MTANASGSADGIASGSRKAFDSASETELEFAIVPRDSLPKVGPVAGPAIITEKETSIVVSSVFEARALEGGDIELLRTARRALAREVCDRHERA